MTISDPDSWNSVIHIDIKPANGVVPIDTTLVTLAHLAQCFDSADQRLILAL